MNDLTAPLSPAQSLLLRTMAHQYLMGGEWPVWQFTVATLDQHDVDAQELIRSLPRVGSTGHVGPSYGLTSHLGPHIAEDDRPALTIAAALHLPELRSYIGEPFLQVLDVLVGMQRIAVVSTQMVVKQRFTLDTILAKLPGLPENFQVRLYGLLGLEPATWNGSRSVPASGAWSCELTRELRHYRSVTTLEEYARTTTARVTAMAGDLTAPAAVAIPAPPGPVPGPYVSEGLLFDLEAKDTALRVDKLLALARELNDNHAGGNPYACQMLLRAILDHVPPVFGQAKFSGVVSNVSWGQTDKAYVKKLAEFRNPADDVLHRQISAQASRIDMDDLPPRSYVNALLQGVLDHLPAPDRSQKTEK
ncbi:hypothetical protein ABT160_24560 [Streptomyces sp. NPDC001941]|uniref:hypothetical protein n=1 Tax=Streptomyces sp. NPDC001941 TaxID=3154659 RepID=UPI003323BA44